MCSLAPRAPRGREAIDRESPGGISPESLGSGHRRGHAPGSSPVGLPLPRSIRSSPEIPKTDLPKSGSSRPTRFPPHGGDPDRRGAPGALDRRRDEAVPSGSNVPVRAMLPEDRVSQDGSRDPSRRDPDRWDPGCSEPRGSLRPAHSPRSRTEGPTTDPRWTNPADELRGARPPAEPHFPCMFQISSCIADPLHVVFGVFLV